MNSTEIFNKEYYFENGEFGFSAKNREDHKRILQLLSNQNNSHILEIGCGLGVLLEKIPSVQKVGIETNDFAVEECKKRGLHVIKADADQGLPFGDASFDIIIMNEMIEHSKKVEFVLRECYRILSPSGKIIMTTPVRSIFVHDLSPTHFSEMSVKKFRQVVEGGGFRIIVHEVNGISFLYPILEVLFFRPIRFIRYLLQKSGQKTKSTVQTVNTIDTCHGFADKFILKPLNIYRRSFLKVGLNQLILVEKRKI